MNRSEMKALAKEQLNGKRGNAIGVLLLNGIVLGAVSLLAVVLGPLAGVAVMLVSGPLTLGMTNFFLNIYYGQKEEVLDLFKGFKNFSGAFVLMFLRSLFITLWSLLFFIPGIVKTYSYSMAFYILAENPEISANEALKRSKEMMKGHRMELFMLQLSFIGWVILSALTFGIGYLYVIPYMNQTVTVFYGNLTQKKVQSKEVSWGTVVESNDPYAQSQSWAGNMENAVPVSQASRDTVVLTSNVSNPTTVLSQEHKNGIFTGVEGCFLGMSYSLPDGEEYSVGRDGEQCGIVVSDEDNSISRLHCTIRYAAQQNGYYVTDYSSNGTFADGVRIPRGQNQFVHCGTVISLGNQRSAFRLE